MGLLVADVIYGTYKLRTTSSDCKCSELDPELYMSAVVCVWHRDIKSKRDNKAKRGRPRQRAKERDREIER